MSRGGRVLLRRPTPDDRDAFLERAHASRRLHDPWVQAPPDAEAYAAFLRGPDGARTERHLVIVRDGGGIAGTFGLSQIFYGPLCSAYLSYYAFEPYAGQGFMGEGLQLLLRHAFGPLRLHRVEANIQPANEASIALVRRAGFRLEGFSPRYLKVGGRWRDHERWALLADEFGGGGRGT